MKTRRWLASAIEQSKDAQVVLPWTRGATRSAMIEKRQTAAAYKRARAAK